MNDPYIQAITNGHPELYDKILYEDAVKWRKEWMDARAAYIQHKIDNNLYGFSDQARPRDADHDRRQHLRGRCDG